MYVLAYAEGAEGTGGSVSGFELLTLLIKPDPLLMAKAMAKARAQHAPHAAGAAI